MPDCEKCKDLHTVFKIKLPAHLKHAICIAQENVADGTIAVIENGTGNWSRTFNQLVATGVWDDIVQYLFKCNSCDQYFRLNAETYHGGGGEWKPLKIDL